MEYSNIQKMVIHWGLYSPLSAAACRRAPARSSDIPRRRRIISPVHETFYRALTRLLHTKTTSVLILPGGE